MKFIDILRMAFGNLKRNKMRTVLTVSGVVVGIGAIVFLVSLGYGLQELMISKVAKLEALTVITVRPGNKDNTTITDDSIKKFKSYSEVSEVSPLLRSPAQISERGATSETVVYGIEPKFWEMEDIKIDAGAKLSGTEAKEAVVSVASLKGLNIANTNDLVGKTLDFKIVQLDASGKAKAGHENDILTLKIAGVVNDDKVKYAYIPLEVVKKLGVEEYGQVKVKVAGRNQVNTVRKAVESIGFQTSSVKDTVDQIDQAFVVIRGVLGGFGMIALFVAAIGIFNTMTISLLERTHEIGIMKAIGGRNRDVAEMFVAESAIIGLMGGIFGVLAGWLLGRGLNALANFLAVSVGGQPNSYFYTPISFSAVVIIFSFCVSTFAGIWPARRASKLNPLEALRYE